ncbi:MAG: LexA family transcriptional regulator [Syntrophomonadaceae bacterium]|nr:LexA family transcriptional regulator [Syntrophomonadaceae bacterium]
MGTLGKRLKYLRHIKKITQKELAGYLQVPRDTLANWEVDRGTPNIEMIAKIADYFGTTSDYLLGIAKNKNIVPLGTKNTKDDLFQKVKMVKIPVYNLDTKREEVLVDSNIIGWHDVPAKFMELIAFRVSDDSMNGSRMCPGDIILVDTHIKPKDNTVVVVKIKNGPMLIRKINYTNDEIILSPTNPKYQLQIFYANEIKIIGVVVRINIDVPY